MVCSQLSPASPQHYMLASITCWHSSHCPAIVCDLGILLFSDHINQFASHSPYFHLIRCIRRCVRARLIDAAKAVVNCFVISRLDCCNTVFLLVHQHTNLIDYKVCRRRCCVVSKFDHICRPITHRLYWLSVQQCIQFQYELFVDVQSCSWCCATVPRRPALAVCNHSNRRRLLSSSVAFVAVLGSWKLPADKRSSTCLK